MPISLTTFERLMPKWTERLMPMCLGICQAERLMPTCLRRPVSTSEIIHLLLLLIQVD